MDGLSIAASCAGLASLALQLGGGFLRIYQAIKDVSGEVEDFAIELRTVARLLSTLEQNLRRPMIANHVSAQSADSSLWNEVRVTLNDLQSIFKRLESILKDLEPGAWRRLEAPLQAWRFRRLNAAITRSRDQIKLHMQVMQLMLFLTLVIDNQFSGTALERRIDVALNNAHELEIGQAVPMNSQDGSSAVSLSRNEVSQVANGNAESIDRTLDEVLSADTQTQTIRHITTVLHTARDLTSASSVSDAASTMSTRSVGSLSLAARSAIEAWIWTASDDVSASVWARLEAHIDTNEVLGRYNRDKGFEPTNFRQFCREISIFCQNSQLVELSQNLMKGFISKWCIFPSDTESYVSEALIHAVLNGMTMVSTQPSDLTSHEGIDENVPKYFLPLVAATCSPEIVALLLLMGADATEAVPGIGTALHAASHFDKCDNILMLLGNGANPDSANQLGFTPLMLACRQKTESVAQILLIHTSNIRYQDNEEKRSALHLSIIHNHFDTALLLISKLTDVNLPDKTGLTPLLLALSQKSDMVIIEALLNQGADLKSTFPQTGETPLQYVITHGSDFTLMKALLDGGADPNSTFPQTGETPLQYVITHGGSFTLTKALLDGGADPKSTFPQTGETPLQYVIAHGGDFALIKALLDGGADPNIVSLPNLMTPLLLACYHGNDYAVIKALLDNGADVHAISPHPPVPPAENEQVHRSCMYYACKNGQNDIITLLLARGYIIDSLQKNRDHDLLDVLAELKDEDLIERIINADPARFVLSVTSSGLTVLHIACLRGLSADLIQWLVDATQDINVRDHNGATPLHLAAKHGNQDIVTLLLHNGANIWAIDKAGVTAVEKATLNESLQTSLFNLMLSELGTLSEQVNHIHPTSKTLEDPKARPTGSIKDILRNRLRRHKDKKADGDSNKPTPPEVAKKVTPIRQVSMVLTPGNTEQHKRKISMFICVAIRAQRSDLLQNCMAVSADFSIFLNPEFSRLPYIGDAPLSIIEKVLTGNYFSISRGFSNGVKLACLKPRNLAFINALILKACERQDSYTLIQLLSTEVGFIRSDSSADTPLHIAARSNSTAIFNALYRYRRNGFFDYHYPPSLDYACTIPGLVTARNKTVQFHSRDFKTKFVWKELHLSRMYFDSKDGDWKGDEAYEKMLQDQKMASLVEAQRSGEGLESMPFYGEEVD